jgi:hypothetical protein
MSLGYLGKCHLRLGGLSPSQSVVSVSPINDFRKQSGASAGCLKNAN